MSESRTYKFDQTSKWLEILPYRGVLVLGISLLLFFPKDRLGPGHEQNSFLLCVILVVALIAAMVIHVLIPKAQVELTLDEIGISRKWIRRFPLQLATDDQIKWDEIKAYLIKPEYLYGDVLRITTKGRKHLSLRHKENILSKDDYRIFIDDLEHRVRMHNAHIASQVGLDYPLIKRKANIYEQPIGLVLAAISVIVLLFIPYVLIHSSPLPASVMIVGSFGNMVWVVNKVYTSRKDRTARRNM